MPLVSPTIAIQQTSQLLSELLFMMGPVWSPSWTGLETDAEEIGRFLPAHQIHTSRPPILAEGGEWIALMPVVLQPKRDPARQAALDAADWVNVVFIRPEPCACVDVDRAERNHEVLFKRARISGVAGADPLHANADIQRRQLAGLRHHVVTSEKAEGILLPQVSHAKRQARVHLVPNEGLVGRE